MYQTMEQIEAKYTKDWVYMINCKEGEYGTTAGGEVVLHSENRDDVIRDMDKFDHIPGLTFFGYVGKIPEDTHYLLQAITC